MSQIARSKGLPRGHRGAGVAASLSVKGRELKRVVVPIPGITAVIPKGTSATITFLLSTREGACSFWNGSWIVAYRWCPLR